MPSRDAATPGRRAHSRVARLLRLGADAAPASPAPSSTSIAAPASAARVVAPTPRDDVPRPPPGVTFPELLRAIWHALPGFLAVHLATTTYGEKPHRAWRATPVALALLPLLAACWIFEAARLTRHGAYLPTPLARLFATLLRASERRRVHGTAWYLLGVVTALAAYPADAAVLAVCLLAWCDPAASLVGRTVRRRTARRGGPHDDVNPLSRELRPGKSLAGTAACALLGALVAWWMFRADGAFAPKVETPARSSTPPRISFFAFIASPPPPPPPPAPDAAALAAFAAIAGASVALVEMHFGRREGGGGGGDEEPGEESSSSPRERHFRRKTFAGGPAGASPNNKRKFARDAYSPEASPRASLDASLEPSEGPAADSPTRRAIDAYKDLRRDARRRRGPTGTAARAVRTRGFLGKAFFLVRRGRSSLGDAFAFVSKADDNVAIPVACGAVAWAARGWLLGWT